MLYTLGRSTRVPNSHSDVSVLTVGSARILSVGATSDNPRWGQLISDWSQTPASELDAINELLPPEWQLADDLFATTAPIVTSDIARDQAAYAYDAIAALGLLASEFAR